MCPGSHGLAIKGKTQDEENIYPRIPLTDTVILLVTKSSVNLLLST